MAAQYAQKLSAKEIAELPQEAARVLDQLTKQELAVDGAIARLNSTPYASSKELQNAQTDVRNMLKRCMAALKVWFWTHLRSCIGGQPLKPNPATRLATALF